MGDLDIIVLGATIERAVAHSVEQNWCSMPVLVLVPWNLPWGMILQISVNVDMGVPHHLTYHHRLKEGEDHFCPHRSPHL